MQLEYVGNAAAANAFFASAIAIDATARRTRTRSALQRSTGDTVIVNGEIAFGAKDGYTDSRSGVVVHA